MTEHSEDGVTARSWAWVGTRAGESCWPRIAARLSAAGLCVALLGLLSGCEGLDVLAPSMEDIVNENPFHHEETNLTPEALADRMKEIDTLYAEPRYFEKVNHSYGVCLQSISHQNDYGALWRGARACAWVALEESRPHSERRDYALKGIAIGKAAVDKASTSAESHYYLALCLAAYADMKQSASKEFLQRISYHAKMARELDPKLDFCGPQRILGRLMVDTEDYPLYAVGTAAEGLALLKEATAMCPEFGENHLVYAKALQKDDEYDQAREQLETLLTLPKPPDHSAEHEAWLKEATQLLTSLQGK